MSKSKSYLTEIKTMLRNHMAWLGDRRNGMAADFAYYDLSGLNLRGINLSSAKLVGANMAKSVLAGANLTGADLFAADLEGADLSGANFYGANLRGACLNGANLTRANLTGADLRGGDVDQSGDYGSVQRFDAQTGLYTTKTVMLDACLANAMLIDTQFQHCDMSGVDLESADLSGADLSGAILIGANIGDAASLGAEGNRTCLDGAIFDYSAVVALQARGVSARTTYKDARGVFLKMMDQHQDWIQSNGRKGRRVAFDAVTLEGLTLDGLNMSGVKLTRSNLRGCSLRGTDLSMADLSYTDLTAASLCQATISGTVFRRANLSNADLSGVRALTVFIAGNQERPWPTNFQRAIMAGADLRAAEAEAPLFHGVDLTKSRLNLIVLRSGNFRGATLPESVSEDKLNELRQAKPVRAGRS